MRRRGAKEPQNEGEGLQVHEAKDKAAGVTGVAVALKRSVERILVNLLVVWNSRVDSRHY